MEGEEEEGGGGGAGGIGVEECDEKGEGRHKRWTRVIMNGGRERFGRIKENAWRVSCQQMKRKETN